MSLSDIKDLDRGSVLLIRYPFTDLSSSKVRPAILLTDTRRATGADGHFVFLGTQPPPGNSSVIPVKRGTEEARAMGLKFDSKATAYIHSGKIATLDVKLVARKLGKAPESVLSSVTRQVALTLGIPSV